MTEPADRSLPGPGTTRSLPWFFVFGTLVLIGGLALLPTATGIALYRRTGYYALFLTFALWCWSMTALLPSRDALARHLRHHAFGLGLATVLVALVFTVSPPRFRVFADEMNLLGVSSSMYHHRETFNPTQQITSFNVRVTLGRDWDKRPLGFPFFVSLAHAWLGFSPRNAFVVNAVFSWLTLVLFYLLLSRWFSRRLALTGMALLPVFPQTLHAMTSGSFEIANLAFLLLAWESFERWQRCRDSANLALLGYTLVLLAQIRYESLLFSGLFGIALILTGWGVPGLHLRLLWPLPFLLLPIGWNLQAISAGNALSESYGVGVFHWTNLWPNLQALITGFFGLSETFPGTPLLMFAGLMGLLWFLVRFDAIRAAWTAQDRNSATLLCIGTLAFTGVLLGYRPANVAAPEAARIALPLIPLLAFFVIWGANQLQHSISRRHLGLLLFLVYAWQWTAIDLMPTRRIAEVREFEMIHRVLNQQFPRQDILVVYPAPGHVIHHGWNGVTFRFLAENREAVRKMAAGGWFQRIIAIQRIQTETGSPTPETTLLEWERGEAFFQGRIDREVQLRFSPVILPNADSGR